MEKVTDQDRLIHALRNDPNLTTWFKSLKPDLRKFQPIKSNGRGLSNVMIDNNEPDGSAGIQLARFLISINVDVNHVYSHTWNYERACFTCRRSEKKYGESDSHRCTPLDAVQGEIEKHKLNGLVHQSQKLTNFFINWNKRLQDLYEVERTLIAAGAKTYDELSQNM